MSLSAFAQYMDEFDRQILIVFKDYIDFPQQMLEELKIDPNVSKLFCTFSTNREYELDQYHMHLDQLKERSIIEIITEAARVSNRKQFIQGLIPLIKEKLLLFNIFEIGTEKFVIKPGRYNFLSKRCFQLICLTN